MKLNIKAMALTAGITWGVMVFVATLWVIIGPTAGETLSKLKMYYLGYSVSFVGAIIGLLWGFVHGCIGGAVFALIYNCTTKCEKG